MFATECLLKIKAASKRLQQVENDERSVKTHNHVDVWRLLSNMSGAEWIIYPLITV